MFIHSLLCILREPFDGHGLLNNCIEAPKIPALICLYTMLCITCNQHKIRNLTNGTPASSLNDNSSLHVLERDGCTIILPMILNSHKWPKIKVRTYVQVTGNLCVKFFEKCIIIKTLYNRLWVKIMAHPQNSSNVCVKSEI